MKVLICEDELIIAEFIKDTCKELGFNVCGIAKNRSDALKLLENESPDLVLLDINLDERMSGVKIGEYISRNGKQPFIYMTAFSDVSTLDAAIQTKPQAYLIKPVDKPTLIANLQLALYKHSARAKKADHFVEMPTESGPVTVNTSRLVFVAACGNYCEFSDDQHEVQLLRISMMQVEEHLAQTHIRIHKSYIINPDFLVRASSLKVFIAGNRQLPIGRKFKDNLAIFFRKTAAT